MTKLRQAIIRRIRGCGHQDELPTVAEIEAIFNKYEKKKTKVHIVELICALEKLGYDYVISRESVQNFEYYTNKKIMPELNSPNCKLKLSAINYE